MRILILGAGAIGGSFGARLVAAGADVTFLVRPARAALLATHGLRVHGAGRAFSRQVRTIVAADRPYDLVLLSCKAYDLDSAIAAITPAVGSATLVLPLLNGLRHLAALDRAFGAARVLGGLAHVSVTLEADGTIRQFGELERLTWGSRDPARPAPAAVGAALQSIGPQVVHSSNIDGAMWNKFALITALAGGTCLMRGAVGEIVATPEGEALLLRLYAECQEVAERSGHPAGPKAIAGARKMLTTPGSPTKASMLRDVERGARTECEHILGDMRARAAGFRIDTPVLSAALAHLRVYEAVRGKPHPAAH